MDSTRLRCGGACGLLFGAVVGLLGCTTASVPREEAPRRTPLAPEWNEAALAEHLRFFNGKEVAGRKTGTQGYARAAAYATSLMEAYELQPAFGSDFRSVYQTAISYPRSATLQILRPDTVRFYPGIDFLPGARSDTGEVRFEDVRLGLDSTRGQPQREVVLLTEQQAQQASLEALRAAGARAVLVAGELRPRPMTSPAQGLVVVQVTPRAAARLLGIAEAEVAAEVERGGQRQLPQPVRLRLQATREPLAGALNVVGYIVGKRPELAREAVIVCADLDAAGPLAGVQTLDLARFGTGAAALLEVARYQTRLSRFLTIPERTVIVALWSGSRLDHAGLRAYLRNPTWSLDYVRAVIYVGIEDAEVPAVEALLDLYDLPLYAVQAEAELPYEEELVLVPDAALMRLVRERDGPEAVSDPPVQTSELLREAVPVARRLAEETHRLLLRETVALAPLLPTLPDTLRPPEEAAR